MYCEMITDTMQLKRWWDISAPDPDPDAYHEPTETL